MSLTKASYSLVNGAPVNVLDYGVSTSSSDNSAAFTLALAAGNSLYIPDGTYTITTTLVIPNGKTIIGANKSTTVIQYTGIGDGIQVGNNPVNGSGYGMSSLRNFKIYCTNAANTGAGIAINAGGYSYYEIDMMYSSGFFYGIVLDQAEVSHVHRSIFETRERVSGTPMWITNGPEWRAGGLKRFTNGITVQDCQFNQGKYAVIDDGGNDHTFIGNNLNGARLGGMYLAGVTGLLITGSAWETGNAEAGTNNLFFSSVGAIGGALKGICKGAQITGNTFAPMAATDLAMISFPSGNLPLYHSGFNITGNYFVEGLGGAPAAIDVTALSDSFCGFNHDDGPLGDPRAHYTGIHNDGNGNVLYPPSGGNNSDSSLAFTFGNTIGSANFSGGFGYGTGAGGSVTQLTSKSTTVVLNKMCGKIITNNAALAADTTVYFGLNNTKISVNDLVIVNVQSPGLATEGTYQAWADVGINNVAIICLRNISAGPLSEAVALTFSVIKGVVS